MSLYCLSTDNFGTAIQTLLLACPRYTHSDAVDADVAINIWQVTLALTRKLCYRKDDRAMRAI